MTVVHLSRQKVANRNGHTVYGSSVSLCSHIDHNARTLCIQKHHVLTETLDLEYAPELFDVVLSIRWN